MAVKVEQMHFTGIKTYFPDAAQTTKEIPRLDKDVIPRNSLIFPAQFGNGKLNARGSTQHIAI